MYVYAPNQTVQTYPYTESMFRAARRAEGVSCRRLAEMDEAQRNSFDVYTVQPTAQPVADVVTEATPVWNVDHFEQAWTTRSYTAEEQAVIDDRAERDALRAEQALQNLVGMTGAEIDAWVDSNVTDMASAKTVLARLAKIIRILASGQL